MMKVYTLEDEVVKTHKWKEYADWGNGDIDYKCIECGSYLVQDGEVHYAIEEKDSILLSCNEKIIKNIIE
jgi:hypothetical protein